MKIAVIGAGAIGSLVAAQLHKSGKNVVLIGKQDQVEAIRANGLSISGVINETVKVPVDVTLQDNPDLVIFATKTQDLEMAYQANCEFLEDALVLSTQNGVQADNLLGGHFEKDQMYSSIVMFGATYMHPGKVTYVFPGNWIIGRPFVDLDPSTHELANTLREAFPVEVVSNIMGMKYTKLFVNFNNCIMAILGQSMQETFADPSFCRLSVRLLKEGLDIVGKANIEMESLPDFSKERLSGLAQMPEDQAAVVIQKTLTTLGEKPIYGSILQSIKRERPSEIDFINGEVVHLAKQMRLSAPLNEKIVDMVHEVEKSQKYFSKEDIVSMFNLQEAEAK